MNRAQYAQKERKIEKKLRMDKFFGTIKRMNMLLLETNARTMVQKVRGILAADESTTSANKRFAAVGVEETEENRRIYRQILFTTPEAKDALSGVIFYDETFWQASDDGRPFHQLVEEAGILPGIKVDEGLIDLPGFLGEKLTKGLDALPERMIKYRDAGARFAKWRAVITVDGELPSKTCIEANAFVLARYARICQDADIVPIVEPEVLFDGTHTNVECERVMSLVYVALFAAMKDLRVHLPGAILKTSMVLPGKDSGIAVDPEDVATRTVRQLHEHVPIDLGGVVFLSGGQTPAQAFLNLNRIAQKGPHPWGVTFSYSRGLQDPVLKYWAAHRDDVAESKSIFAHQLKIAVDASLGKLNTEELGGDYVSQSQDS
jgi:fructose-bisphosphate aldolase class I